jgi:hypothetical protein
MTLLQVDVETIPSLPNLILEPIMSIQVEDLVQAVAEGVFRAAEARGGSSQGGQAAAAGQAAVSSRTQLIPQLSFEVRIRAGGIPGPFQVPAVE